MADGKVAWCACKWTRLALPLVQPVLSNCLLPPMPLLNTALWQTLNVSSLTAFAQPQAFVRLPTFQQLSAQQLFLKNQAKVLLLENMLLSASAFSVNSA